VERPNEFAEDWSTRQRRKLELLCLKIALGQPAALYVQPSAGGAAERFLSAKNLKEYVRSIALLSQSDSLVIF